MKTALVLSPFATWPADVGHRRRTLQTTAMLKEAGYHVTFLLYAFEGGWYWRFQDRDVAEMRQQWDEVLIVHAEHSVGLPPREGRFHALDEWWSAELETQLRNLFRHRHFDLFVVHNVWLSKALSLAPRATTTVLETHDLFWKRRALLDRLGIGHDFYEPEQAAEIFGINRAQIAMTIQEKDARELLPLVSSKVVTVPFYDAAVEAGAAGPERRGYLHPDKVVFGFLGSAHTYNVSGMRAVLKALEERVARSFAPVDLVLGGTASTALETRLSCRRLGRVPTEVGFYAQCDVALAPTFEGTGFKIKVADMLALGMPSLVAAHSAIGTSLAGEMVVETPEEMADAMVRIATTRPPLGGLRAGAATAREELKRRAALGRSNAFRLLHTIKPGLVVDLSVFGPEKGILPLVSYFSLIRHLPAHAATTLVVRPDVRAIIEPFLPLGLHLADADEADAATRHHPRRVLLQVGGRRGAAIMPLREADLLVQDNRWNWLDPDAAPGPDTVGVDLPLAYPDIAWDPLVSAIRQAWRSLDHKGQAPEGVQRIVFVDWVGARGPATVARLASMVWIVDVNDTAETERALMAILAAPEEGIEVVWATSGHATLRALVMEAALSRRQKVSGLLDGCFHGSANGRGLLGNVDTRFLWGVREILGMGSGGRPTS